MQPCPHCGGRNLILGRNVTIWQTIGVTVQEDGNYIEGPDELHDINDRTPGL